MVTYKLYLIRHGMTEGNREGRYVGWEDMDLCDEGIEELLAMKKRYEYPPVAEVYCSPLTRCIHTADILYPEQEITVVEELKELSLGEFEGKRIEDLANLPAYQAWIANALRNTPPGSLETGEQFSERIRTALNTIFMDMTRRKITSAAIVTHGGVIMGLLSSFALPQQHPSTWATSNGGGFAISMTTQMWMRDNGFEVLGHIPLGFSSGDDARVKASLGIK